MPPDLAAHGIILRSGLS